MSRPAVINPSDGRAPLLVVLCALALISAACGSAGATPSAPNGARAASSVASPTAGASPTASAAASPRASMTRNATPGAGPTVAATPTDIHVASTCVYLSLASSAVDGVSYLTVLAWPNTEAHCAPQTTIAVTIFGPDGQPLAGVQGNGAAHDVDLGVPGEQLPAKVFLAWADWCGAQGPFTAYATAPGSNSATQPIAAPHCADASASVLQAQPDWPPCGPGDWPPSGNGQRDQAGPAIAVESYADGDAVRLELTAMSAPGCRLATGLTLTLVGADGRPLPDQSNGLDVALQRVAPDQYAQVAVTWSNWCGDTNGLAARVTLLGRTLTARLSATPPCVTPDQPTTLTADAVTTLAGAPSDWAQQFYSAIASGTPTPTSVPDSALPPCAADAFQLAMLSGGGTPGTPITVAARATSASAPCRPAGDIALVLQDGNAQPLAVRGNPISAPLGADLTSADGLVATTTFYWAEWCGDRTDIQWEATVADHRLTMTAAFSPRCDAPDIPSVLRLPPTLETGPTPTATP